MFNLKNDGIAFGDQFCTRREELSAVRSVRKSRVIKLGLRKNAALSQTISTQGHYSIDI
jgi:hypothetical protein